MEDCQMNKKKLSEYFYSRKQHTSNPSQLVNEKDLNEFKDFREITLMANKHKTTRGRIITALIAAQAKQEETLEWQY
jgi:hypothetical protein